MGAGGARDCEDSGLAGNWAKFGTLFTLEDVAEFVVELSRFRFERLDSPVDFVRSFLGSYAGLSRHLFSNGLLFGTSEADVRRRHGLAGSLILFAGGACTEHVSND